MQVRQDREEKEGVGSCHDGVRANSSTHYTFKDGGPADKPPDERADHQHNAGRGENEGHPLARFHLIPPLSLYAFSSSVSPLVGFELLELDQAGRWQEKA